MNTPIATKAPNAVAAFSSFLDRYKPQIALALPKHLNADRMARLAVTCFAKNRKLQECTPVSILAALITSSQLGLEIDVNGQAYLVPYKRTATLVPGWKGLTDLANRSGRCTVWTGAVFQGDEFEYQLGDSPFIRHRPGDNDDPDMLTHVYAVGRVKGSDWAVIEVWRMSKIWKHRDAYNKVGGEHYSFKSPEMYARKVPLLQVLKYMPASIELSNALAVANAAEVGQNAVLAGDFVTTTDIDMETGEIVGGAPAAPAPTGPKIDAVRAATAAKKASAPFPPPAPASAPAAEPADQTGATTGVDPADDPSASADPVQHKFDEVEFAKRLQRCSDVDTLNVMIDEARVLPEGDMKDRISEIYHARLKAIG